MKFSELELKRGDTIVLKADLTAVKIQMVLPKFQER